MYVVEVTHAGGRIESVSCLDLQEAHTLMRDLRAMEGLSTRLIARTTILAEIGESIESALSMTKPVVAPVVAPSAPVAPVDPSTGRPPSIWGTRGGTGSLEALTGPSPLGNPEATGDAAATRFPGATPSPAGEPPQDSPVALKAILWRAMHRVQMANVPWADDFAALLAAMSALMRVHSVTVTAPLENLAVVHPRALLADASVMVALVGQHGRALTPWPAALDVVTAAALRLFEP